MIFFSLGQTLKFKVLRAEVNIPYTYLSSQESKQHSGKEKKVGEKRWERFEQKAFSQCCRKNCALAVICAPSPAVTRRDNHDQNPSV